MTQMEAERAQAASRARQRGLEAHAELFLNGRWSLRKQVDQWEPLRQSAPLWMAGEEELLAAAAERWPEYSPAELVAVAVRLQGASTKRQRHLDPRAYMTTVLQYAQSWIHDWRERHPRGTEEEAWRAFELAEGVRKIARSSFKTYFGQARPAAERLKDELRIQRTGPALPPGPQELIVPAPHANGADGPERIEPAPPREPDTFGVPGPLDPESGKELPLYPEDSTLRVAADEQSLEAVPAEDPGSFRWPATAGLELPPRLLVERLLVEGRRGRFEATKEEGAAWLVKLELTPSRPEVVDELLELARRLVR